ncbi:MAG: FG-GAP-like repeat-containing protein, partial [Candidatus Eisenbacteria bacterium]|nr:FG-GAP-like repeat-containing protein [Candidatus Eisenbacteria bacterium]
YTALSRGLGDAYKRQDWAGRAYLFYGPLDSQLDASHADATITAEAFGDNLGFSAAGGFDIDGDGFDDLIVGARSNDGNGIQAGRAYVFRGPLHGDRPATSADVIVSGDEFDELGRAVAAGDLNGDGHDDLVIAAPLASQGPISSGAVYVYFGPVDGSLGTAGASASITGVLFNEELGSSLAIGDLNGDGVDDLAIGAPRPPVNGADTGRTYVFFGPIEGGPRNAEQAEVTVFGEDLSDAFGTSVAIGDVDGDGLGDLVAGAPQIFEGGPGKAYVMLSPLDAVIQAGSADAILTGEEPGDVFGNAVAVLPGDSGHGAGAVLAGAWDDNAGGTRAGRAYLFRGPLAGARSASSADLFVTGGPGPDQLGLSVASAGDLNGDGRADILAGAPQFDDQGAGFAVVVYRACLLYTSPS